MNGQKAASKDSAGLWVIGVAAPIGLMTIAAGPAVFCWQIFLWLRDGKWTDIQFGWIPWKLGVDPAGIGWLGVRKIVVAVYHLPMWLALIPLGLIISFGGVWIGEWLDRHKV